MDGSNCVINDWDSRDSLVGFFLSSPKDVPKFCHRYKTLLQMWLRGLSLNSSSGFGIDWADVLGVFSSVMSWLDDPVHCAFAGAKLKNPGISSL